MAAVVSLRGTYAREYTQVLWQGYNGAAAGDGDRKYSLAKHCFVLHMLLSHCWIVAFSVSFTALEQIAFLDLMILPDPPEVEKVVAARVWRFLMRYVGLEQWVEQGTRGGQPVSHRKHPLLRCEVSMLWAALTTITVVSLVLLVMAAATLIYHSWALMPSCARLCGQFMAQLIKRHHLRWLVGL